MFPPILLQWNMENKYDCIDLLTRQAPADESIYNDGPSPVPLARYLQQRRWSFDSFADKVILSTIMAF